MKIRLILGLLALCLMLGYLVFSLIKDNPEVLESKTYQGPVRLTDDLEHFRETGETKSLEVKEDGLV